MKKWYLLLIAFFVAPIIFLFGFSLVDRDEELSGTEELSQFPKFSFASLLNGEFTAGFEAYFADQFPLRDLFMGGAKYINSLYALNFGSDEIQLNVDVDNDWEHGASVDPDNDDDVLQTVTTTGRSEAESSDSTSSEEESSGSTSVSETGMSGSSGETSEESSSVEATEETPAETTFVTSWVELESPWEDESGDSEDVTSVPDVGILIIGDSAMEPVYKVDSYLDDYAETVNSLYDSLGGVRVYAMLVPKSIEFNAPAAYRTQLSAINYAYSQLKVGVICVDAYSELYEHRDEYLYFRTDHHWSQRGAYYGFRAFCNAANLTPYELSDYSYEVVPDFLGSMYTYTRNYAASDVLKNNPDDVEVFRPLTVATMEVFSDRTLSDGSEKNIIYSTSYATESLDSSMKYLLFMGGDRPICRIANEGVDNGRKALILKESYGNVFTPFLGDVFEEVWAIDPRSFNGEDEPVFTDLADFVSEQGITDVIVLNNLHSAIPTYMSNIRDLLG